jgi:protein SCO1
MIEMLHARGRRAAAMAFAVAIALLLFPLSIRADSAFASGPGVVGIEQKLGSFVPLDVSFTDETGAAVTLARLIHTPTILALVYYQCPNVCDYLLTGLAGTLGALPSLAGTDYNVVTISIDPVETPADARKAKRIGLETIGKPFPEDAWRFLTGNEASIDVVANAVGFRYAKSAGGFDHPVALVILSPTGKIVRYMMGADFLPADMQLSLMEAQKGVVGQTIAKIMRICFRVDPTSHQLVFNALRVVGAVTLLGATGLVVFLIVLTRRRRRV